MKFFQVKVLFTACTAALSLSITPAFSQLRTAATINEGVEIARKEHKPLMVIINVYRNPSNPSADEKYKLVDPQKLSSIGSRFILVQGPASNPDLLQLVTKHKLTTFPTWIFMNDQQEAFYTSEITETFPANFNATLDKAFAASKLTSISESEAQLALHKTDNEWLKNLINQRKKSGEQDNSELIDMYVKNLSVKDLSNYQTVLFILEAGSQLDGYAYRMAYTDRSIVDSIFKKETPKRRADFLRIIRNNTFNDGLRTKNENKIRAVATSLRSSWGKDYRNAGISSGITMLNYYMAVGDTAKFLQQSIYFYEGYYMNMSADSIKKIDAKNRIATLARMQTNVNGSIRPALNSTNGAYNPNNLSQKQIDSLKIAPNTIIKREIGVRSTIVSGQFSNSVATALNSGAWNVYLTNTRNINYLTKAMIWSRRAIELNPSPSYYDTLAHILYRLLYFEEAEKTQKMAIKLAGAAGTLTDSMQKSLVDMKARTL